MLYSLNTYTGLSLDEEDFVVDERDEYIDSLKGTNESDSVPFSSWPSPNSMECNGLSGSDTETESDDETVTLLHQQMYNQIIDKLQQNTAVEQDLSDITSRTRKIRRSQKQVETYLHTQGPSPLEFHHEETYRVFKPLAKPPLQPYNKERDLTYIQSYGNRADFSGFNTLFNDDQENTYYY